ncbi:MAG TPA: TraR/DksA C4-type zinc finger protein [Candidatus Paceibacterota bacterium]|nr:TraR/DksA C4-type zinc finger protein [Candidatus Paceibacterota bacterium]
MLDKKKIKENLEKEKKELMEQLADIGRRDPATGDWEAVPEKQDMPESDQNDMADRFEEFESRSSTTNVLEERLSSVESSLADLDNDSFGKCEVCEKEIEEDRMEANPAAKTCKEHLEG